MNHSLSANHALCATCQTPLGRDGCPNKIRHANAFREAGFKPDMRGAPVRPGAAEDRYTNNDVLVDVAGERQRQDIKWGEQNHGPEVWIRILGEEYGEVCKAVNDSDQENYIEELIQVAAVAVAAVECARRRKTKAYR